jgi:hypothetical protein
MEVHASFTAMRRLRADPGQCFAAAGMTPINAGFGRAGRLCAQIEETT